MRRIGIVLCFLSLVLFNVFYELNDQHLFGHKWRVWAYLDLAIFITLCYFLFLKTGIAYWGSAKLSSSKKDLDERQTQIVDMAHRQGYLIMGTIFLFCDSLAKRSSNSEWAKFSYDVLSSSMLIAFALIPLSIIVWHEKEVCQKNFFD